MTSKKWGLLRRKTCAAEMMLWSESGLRLRCEHAVVEMTDRKRCGVVAQKHLGLLY